ANPLNVLFGVEPDMRENRGQVHMLAGAQCLHADTFSFEVGDAVNSFVPEQFEAADVHASQIDNWLARIDCDDVRTCVIHAEINVSGGDCRHQLGTRDRRDIFNFTKAFRTQQFLGGVLGAMQTPGGKLASRNVVISGPASAPSTAGALMKWAA